MNQEAKWTKFLFRSISYVLVAAVASAVTMLLWGPRNPKLAELEKIIDQKFVGQYDEAYIQDVAAGAMVAALGDRWSFYLTAEEYQTIMSDKSNSFVGIGVTVVLREDGVGEEIVNVIEGGPAYEAGLQVGDIIIRVDGTSVAGFNTAETRNLIEGEENTQVTVTVLRDSQELDFAITRKTIRIVAAKGQLLPGNIGLVQIENFNDNCASETIAAIKQLQEQGATALIFDVRNNPGGYVNEMVKVLDYLLPACVVFREMDYRGIESSRYSDAACVELPMAVLVNGESYSAAEFFAACLQEYDKATVVGEKTSGKSYYQHTIRLSDGSAVNLSTGKYFTPGGKSLTELGGLTPDIPKAVDEETAAKIYADLLAPEEDPQLQAAVAAILQTNG
ncbi:MAG: S41 family peptidase [Oscillospiraceae bacterium]|nr:S41 family peptidase [Oscillospiraceae bacterium]